MDQAIRHLVQTVDYDVPLQDLSVRLNRIPTAPHDGVRIRQVHRVAPRDQRAADEPGGLRE